MIQFRTFHGPDYISLRTKIHAWLEKRPQVRVLHTFGHDVRRKDGSIVERVIVVQYERT